MALNVKKSQAAMEVIQAAEKKVVVVLNEYNYELLTVLAASGGTTVERMVEHATLQMLNQRTLGGATIGTDQRKEG
nr:hypothetical protein [uncultured Sphaerochaeta sp.]